MRNVIQRHDSFASKHGGRAERQRIPSQFWGSHLLGIMQRRIARESLQELLQGCQAGFVREDFWSRIGMIECPQAVVDTCQQSCAVFCKDFELLIDFGGAGHGCDSQTHTHTQRKSPQVRSLKSLRQEKKPQKNSTNTHTNTHTLTHTESAPVPVVYFFWFWESHKKLALQVSREVHWVFRAGEYQSWLC